MSFRIGSVGESFTMGNISAIGSESFKLGREEESFKLGSESFNINSVSDDICEFDLGSVSSLANQESRDVDPVRSKDPGLQLYMAVCFWYLVKS